MTSLRGPTPLVRRGHGAFDWVLIAVAGAREVVLQQQPCEVRKSLSQKPEGLVVRRARLAECEATALLMMGVACR